MKEDIVDRYCDLVQEKLVGNLSQTAPRRRRLELGMGISPTTITPQPATRKGGRLKSSFKVIV